MSIGVHPGACARLPSSSEAGQSGWSRAASACVHATVLLALCRLLWVVPPPPEVAVPVTMVFAPSDTPEVRTIVLPSSTIPTRRAESAALALPPPARIGPPVARLARPAQQTNSSTAAQDRPERDVAPIPAPPAKLDVQPPAPDAVAFAGFAGQVQRAVQAAASYPPVARRMGVQGRVQVTFDFQGGGVFSVAVSRASQSSMLDRAALAAVREAIYPRPPDAAARRRLPMVVWVDFSLRPDG